MTAVGTKVLVIGAPGSGKTHALRTLVDAGLEVCCLFTDNGMDVMRDTRHASDKYKAALAEHRVHWRFIAPAKTKWADMNRAFDIGASFDIGTLQKNPATDKKAFPQFGQVLSSMEKFVCDDCGKDLGNVDDWDSSRALCFDGVSGTNSMLLSWAAGSKPAVSQPEWGQAMKMQLAFFERMTLGLNCHTVIIAHLDREVDLISGGIKLMPAALGQKNAPQFGKWFTDIILAERAISSTGTNIWTWNTARTDADVKARNLPWKDKQEPDFVPLINNWRNINATR